MTRRRLALAALPAVGLLLALAGCERPQSMSATARKSDTPVWAPSDNRWAPKDVASGDKAAWERQIAVRAQSQNEYLRADKR